MEIFGINVLRESDEQETFDGSSVAAEAKVEEGDGEKVEAVTEEVKREVEGEKDKAKVFKYVQLVAKKKRRRRRWRRKRLEKK